MDDYGHFLAIYIRFGEEDSVGTQREGVFAPKYFLWSLSAKFRFTFEGDTIRIFTSEHHRLFSTHGCKHYCIFQGIIPKVGDSLSDRLFKDKQGVCN